jgi:Domain of unknown function (DUF4150)
VKGTTTVWADGGFMIAVRGSQFANSTGDEPGVAGGVASGVNRMETNWMTFSLDVFCDGKNVCRQTDKQFHNHYNTVNLLGQHELDLWDVSSENLLRILCEYLCGCLDDPGPPFKGKNMYQYCMEQEIQKLNEKMEEKRGFRSPLEGETRFKRDPFTGDWDLGTGTKGNGRRMDAVVKKFPDKPLSMQNLDKIVEVKFAKEGYRDCYRGDQWGMEWEIAEQAGAEAVLLTPEACGCAGQADPDSAMCEEEEERLLEEYQEWLEYLRDEQELRRIFTWSYLVTMAVLGLAAWASAPAWGTVAAVDGLAVEGTVGTAEELAAPTAGPTLGAEGAGGLAAPGPGPITPPAPHYVPPLRPPVPPPGPFGTPPPAPPLRPPVPPLPN